MKAIGHTRTTALSAEDALVELEVARPKPGPRDLLVAIRGVSMNPVDVKVRALLDPPEGGRILGYDASGIVEEVGAQVSLFKPGDTVFYAGDITRQGSNAAYQLVDERIVGRKPNDLDHATAAAMPLTAITAWEILFDSFGHNEGGGSGDALLIIGGAGGVGSILIQLAKKLTDLTVIATASRPETQAWVEKMGADHVVNHRNPLDEELSTLNLSPRYVAALTHTDRHFESIVQLIKPRGHIAMIDDPENLNLPAIKPKALTLSWEFMFARSMFQTDDMIAQHHLLNRVADLLDQGTLIPTASQHYGPMSIETLRRAHQHQESGKAIGKTVLDGFEV